MNKLEGKSSIASRKLLALLPLCVLVTTCQMIPTTATTENVPDVCLVWNAIDYSASGDTPETVLDIRKSNAAHDTYCAKK